jgi:hypothetical protein
MWFVKITYGVLSQVDFSKMLKYIISTGGLAIENNHTYFVWDEISDYLLFKIKYNNSDIILFLDDIIPSVLKDKEIKVYNILD